MRIRDLSKAFAVVLALSVTPVIVACGTTSNIEQELTEQERTRAELLKAERIWAAALTAIKVSVEAGLVSDELKPKIEVAVLVAQSAMKRWRENPTDTTLADLAQEAIATVIKYKDEL